MTGNELLQRIFNRIPSVLVEGCTIIDSHVLKNPFNVMIYHLAIRRPDGTILVARESKIGTVIIGFMSKDMYDDDNIRTQYLLRMIGVPISPIVI